MWPWPGSLLGCSPILPWPSLCPLCFFSGSLILSHPHSCAPSAMGLARPWQPLSSIPSWNRAARLGDRGDTRLQESYTLVLDPPLLLCSAFPCLKGSHRWGVTRSFTSSSLKTGQASDVGLQALLIQWTHTLSLGERMVTALGSPPTTVPSLTQELSFPLWVTCPVQALWSGIQAAIEEKTKRILKSLLASWVSTHTEKQRSCENTKRRRLSAGHG